jgi:diguanylate cyclase (GGDEF)-like protein
MRPNCADATASQGPSSRVQLRIAPASDPAATVPPSAESINVSGDDRQADHARLLSELERSKRELTRAREKIAELTRSQNQLSSTVGRLTELASTDVLTGLSNRRSFGEALAANFTLAVRQSTPLSAVMIDVDLFKSYNDAYGHSAGDLVLSIVARQLLSTCSSYDVVARHGGEEFAVLLPAADAAQALECAERQRAAIASYPWPLRQVTASFGVSTLGPGTRDPMTLLEEADRALYQSKRGGRNRVTHYRATEPTGAPDAKSAAPKAPPPGFPRAPSEATSSLSGREGAPDSSPRGTSMLNGTISAHPVARPRPSGASSGEVAWDALDRFILELQDGKLVPDQYRTALAGVCEGTGAQLAFVYAEKTGMVLELAGERASAAPACRDIALALTRECPRGGLWEVPGPFCEPVIRDGPAVSSAAVLPVETPQPGWLVALRFEHARPFHPADLRFMRVIWRLQVGHKRHVHVHDNLKETLFGVVRCLSTAIDAKDPYTCGHSERVARIAVRIGEEMRLTRGEISDLYLAGLLHDVGKIGVRDEVLRKDGPLTPEEYDHIKEHPAIGERIIANVTRLSYLRPGIRGHHERFDGRGYPDGLAGDDIPLMARILAVADSCDAMMSNRRYRPALSPVRIEGLFRDGHGTQWDPRIVEHFFDCRNELFAVCQRGLGQSVYMAVERAAAVIPTRMGSRSLGGA